jgi:hypothetical protein
MQQALQFILTMRRWGEVSMRPLPVFSHLSDAALVAEVGRLAQIERERTVELIASLEEFDRRRLFVPAGYRSMFTYCTQQLLLAEGAAYVRIQAARLTRRFPIILEKLECGSITLTAIGLLGPHLTEANHVSLIEEAHHKTKTEVECIVARLRPKPDVPTVIRKVPQARVEESLTVAPPTHEASPAPLLTSPPAPKPVIAPLTPERFKLQITMDRETHDTLREIQDLIRHSVPTGDAAIIVARALTLLREQLLRQKVAKVRRPRGRKMKIGPGTEPIGGANASGAANVARCESGSRSAAIAMLPPFELSDPPRSRGIDADVRREVWQRDGGQCAFVGTDGRCRERAFLEFHHVDPFAAGGASDATNIELRCRVHNSYEAALYFGVAKTSGLVRRPAVSRHAGEPLAPLCRHMVS